MNYSCELVESIDDVDAEEWASICCHANNLFLDPRFLKAVELSFKPDARIWYAIFRDANGTAVAINCYSQYYLDGALMTPPLFQNMVSMIRSIWPSFAKFSILLGALPISLTDNQLAVSPDVNYAWIVADLCEIAQKLATENRCRFTYFREFSQEWASRLDGFESYGFIKLHTQFAYCLHGEYRSFDDYLESKGSGSRRTIRVGLRRFEEAGLKVEELRGRDGVDELFTPEVHQLYVNVFNQAKVRFELIPIEFFQEFARQHPDNSCFNIVRKDGKIVGFSCGLAGESEYIGMYMGRDYTVSRESELYFNLIYADMKQAFAPGIQKVHLGSTSDTFKQRLGCKGEWLTSYIKAKRPIGTWILKQITAAMFKTEDPVQETQRK